ncbi:MAG TPA: hypothetical protein V6D33_12540 [Cyanophyceae cyanobacterium]
MSFLRSRIQRFRNRRRLQKGLRRAKKGVGYYAGVIRDGLVETAGTAALIGLANKARKAVAPTPFSRRTELALFRRKRLTKEHRSRISRALKNRTNLDQNLKRVETGSKIFRGYAGGVRSLAAAAKYRQEVSRADTGLRRLDRLSAIAYRGKRFF